MKLFYRQIELTSKLSKVEIAERLRPLVFPDSKHFDFNLVETMPVVYKGVVDDNSFYMKRVPGRRDGWFPIITGEVLSNPGNTSIEIEMRVSKFEENTFVAQLIIFSMFFICFLVYSIYNNAFGLINFLPLLMLVFGSAVMISTFNQESAASEKYLRRLFESE